MKHLLPTFAISLLCMSAIAQPVPKKKVVEHFTNTICPPCAGRNPGFFTNLAANPQVLHIAYYPSAPYSYCPFHMLNKVENDARTNFYGIYGSTPRLVVDGAVIPANADYTSATIFPAAAMSDYTLNIAIRRISADTGEATIKVKKVAANSLSGLSFFAVVTEDTILFLAGNGERKHYNRFRKSLTGASPETLAGLVNVGDSILKTYNFYVGADWATTRVTAMLQDSMKNGLQAARSTPFAYFTGVAAICTTPLYPFPNPVVNELFFSGLSVGKHSYTITNVLGQPVLRGELNDPTIPINTSALQSGIYILTLESEHSAQRTKFVKR